MGSAAFLWLSAMNKNAQKAARFFSLRNKTTRGGIILVRVFGSIYLLVPPFLLLSPPIFIYFLLALVAFSYSSWQGGCAGGCKDITWYRVSAANRGKNT
jgi:hypothetical protein